MLFVPYGWDQPDYASRMQRLGVALHIARHDYTVDTATSALTKLLRTTQFTNRAAAVRTLLAAEDGLATACAAIESLLEDH